MPAGRAHREPGAGCLIAIAVLVIAVMVGVVGPEQIVPWRAEAKSAGSAELVHPPVGTLPVRSSFDDLIVREALEHGVDPNLMRALVHWESGYNPTVVSSAGAVGLGQLMPETAAKLGVVAPLDPAANLDGSTRLMAQLLARYDSQLDLALAGYNAGEPAVTEHAGVPPYPETQRFVAGVTALYAAYGAAGF